MVASLIITALLLIPAIDSSGTLIAEHCTPDGNFSQLIFSEGVLLKGSKQLIAQQPATISTEDIKKLEAELDVGAAIPAAQRFYDTVAAQPREALQANGAMRLVWSELTRQLESFNPIFTATLLQVQKTMGMTAYEARDDSLQLLIQPLTGEYGLGADKPLAQSHRKLLARFYESVTGESLTALLADSTVQPIHAEALFTAMLRDVTSAGGRIDDALGQASYALGYNLAVEYVASKLSKFALQSWRTLDSKYSLQGLDWEFLETHAQSESGHADIGHQSAAGIVPVEYLDLMHQGMRDHDRDFALFNNRLAEMLQLGSTRSDVIHAHPSAHAKTICRSAIRNLERELDYGSSIPAAKRFFDAVAALPRDALRADGAMRRVWSELARQLESFNPIFTATILKLQSTLGMTNYNARDDALQMLIQPLAGEYGLSAGKPLAQTHRRLLSSFYQSITGEPLTVLLADAGPGAPMQPSLAEELFEAMLRDVTTGGGRTNDTMAQASYALGYNLAVEYVASHLSRFALNSWRALDAKYGLQGLDWEFLETHAKGESGHAEIGHKSAAAVVPNHHLEIMRQGMRDHDRDFALFNNRLAELLEPSLMVCSQHGQAPESE